MTLGDDRLFFQLAAALLPTLAFGGLLTERLRPPKDLTPGKHHAVLVALILGCQAILFAEILAIEATISGEPTALHRVFVSATLMGATVVLLTLIVGPWLAGEGSSMGRLGRIPGAILLVGAVLLTVTAVRTFDTAIKLTSAKEQLGRERQIGEKVDRLSDLQEENSRRLTRAVRSYPAALKRRRGESKSEFKLRREGLEIELKSLSLRGRTLNRRLDEAFEEQLETLEAARSLVR